MERRAYGRVMRTKLFRRHAPLLLDSDLLPPTACHFSHRQSGALIDLRRDDALAFFFYRDVLSNGITTKSPITTIDRHPGFDRHLP